MNLNEVHEVLGSEATITYRQTYYMLTIKPTYNEWKNDKQRIDKRFNEITARMTIHKQVYENDSKHLLHIHALVSGTAREYIKHQQGWSIKLIKCHTLEDKNRWCEYLDKYPYQNPLGGNEDCVLYENYIYNQGLCVTDYYTD